MALALFATLLTLDPILLLRHGISTGPGPVEFSLALAGKMLDWPVEWFTPEPGGRDQVFYRDIEMVSHADLVLAIFSEAGPMEGGTAHVVEKAQDKGVPVYAYSWVDDHLRRVGEHDPGQLWAELVPHG